MACIATVCLATHSAKAPLSTPHTYHDDEAPRTECTLMKSDLLAYELYDTQGTNVEGDNGVYCECTRQNEAAHAKREHPLERSA